LKASSEAKKLTAEVKDLALDSGASVVGIVSAGAIDALPPVWIGWKIQEYTKKACELMPDARSIVVMGYHIWDDMLELAIRKGDRWVYPEYFPLGILERTIIECLEKKSYKALAAYSLSCKRLAQLAGLGNYGKNALIVSPVFGPWIRLTPILTNAEMIPDKPFEKDLCGDCENCVKACPAGALNPYKVDDKKCLVGIHLIDESTSKHNKVLAKYEPSLSRNSHLMCMECQKACEYGKEKHQSGLSISI